jgi:hypothetical protein
MGCISITLVVQLFTAAQFQFAGHSPGETWLGERLSLAAFVASNPIDIIRIFVVVSEILISIVFAIL